MGVRGAAWARGAHCSSLSWKGRKAGRTTHSRCRASCRPLRLARRPTSPHPSPSTRKVRRRTRCLVVPCRSSVSFARLASLPLRSRGWTCHTKSAPTPKSEPDARGGSSVGHIDSDAPLAWEAGWTKGGAEAPLETNDRAQPLRSPPCLICSCKSSSCALRPLPLARSSWDAMCGELLSQNRHPPDRIRVMFSIVCECVPYTQGRALLSVQGTALEFPPFRRWDFRLKERVSLQPLC